MKKSAFLILLILMVSCSSKTENSSTSSKQKSEEKGTPLSKIVQDKIVLNATDTELIKKHVDKWVTVRGRVFQVYAPEKSKAIFINFSNNKNKGFTSVVFTSNLDKWPGGREFFTSLIGKFIELEGPIQEYKGKFEIIINSPSQLNIIAEGANFKIEIDFGISIARMDSEDVENQDENTSTTKMVKNEEPPVRPDEPFVKSEEHHLFLGDELSIKFVLVPPGKFLMGTKVKPFDPYNNSNPKEYSRNEQPEHEVIISKPFYLGKYEVTQEQWFKIMNTNPSLVKGRTLPVTNISLKECRAFIQKLNNNTDREYRLPSEAEWEYSCKAKTNTVYSFGDEITPKDANFNDSNIGTPVAVGSYKPNAFGIYDMHGNVSELCNDWFGPYKNDLQTDPSGPIYGGGQTVRGGSYFEHDLRKKNLLPEGGLMPGPSFDQTIGFAKFRPPQNTSLASSGRSFLLVNNSPSNDTSDPTIGFRLALTKIPVNKNPLAKISLGSPFTETDAKETQKIIGAILGREIEEKESIGKGLMLEMILIPAGSFLKYTKKTNQPAISKRDALIPAGSFFSNSNYNIDEIKITKPFYVGKFEITQEQWMALMGANISSQKGSNLSVTNVSWYDCQEFINKLNGKTNGGYRLPTEAEWEYACRAGYIDLQANVNNSNPFFPVMNSGTLVGSYKPNAFGLYDMHGYFEWCNDWHGSTIKDSTTDPVGPKSGTTKVLRSGSLFRNSTYTSYSYRNNAAQPSRSPDCSFRIVKSINYDADVLAQQNKLETQTMIPIGKTTLEQPFSEKTAKEIQLNLAKTLNIVVEKKINLSTNVKLEMVLIPSGKFMMGSPISESFRKADETQHEIGSTKPFYIGKYEVTQEQWGTVLGRDLPKGVNPKAPISKISWDDCQIFIHMINEEYGGGFRLPMEYEWEYACKAGTTTPYFYGDSITKTEGNFDGFFVKPVGSYKPNAFGLYDMHGNVSEWCTDFYLNYPGNNIEKNKNLETHHILRGGAYNQTSQNVRSSSRLSSPQNYRATFNGLRLVKTISP